MQPVQERAQILTCPTSCDPGQPISSVGLPSPSDLLSSLPVLHLYILILEPHSQDDGQHLNQTIHNMLRGARPDEGERLWKDRAAEQITDASGLSSATTLWDNCSQTPSIVNARFI